MNTRSLRNQVRAMRRRLPAPEGCVSLESWQRISQTLYDALEPFMDARIAVAAALVKLEEEYPELKTRGVS